MGECVYSMTGHMSAGDLMTLCICESYVYPAWVRNLKLGDGEKKSGNLAVRSDRVSSFVTLKSGAGKELGTHHIKSQCLARVIRLSFVPGISLATGFVAPLRSSTKAVEQCDTALGICPAMAPR
jgi:hypothetical protein